MDKDEILSKHKNENRFGDEREKTIRTRRDAFSLWGVLGLGMVFMGLKIWQGQSPLQRGPPSASAPFPGPALHGIGSGYSWRDAPLSSGALMVLYFLPVVKGKGGSFFTKSPEKWQNFQWNHPSSGEKTAWLPPFAKKTLQILLTSLLGVLYLICKVHLANQQLDPKR